MIDVNKWIDKNGSFDEAGGLDLVRHGYEWIRRMRKFENKADRHTFQKVFGNKRGNRHKYSRVMFDYGDNCPLTGMCYDYYLLKPIIDYYNAWCTYPEDFSLEDLMRQCYDNFFKSWHEEYEYWADNEDAIREELHHNQYEDRLYYENGDVYVEPLNEIA